MTNNATRQGGRPPAYITKERVRRVMRRICQGGCYLGDIMVEFGVSQTTAMNLRKKAFKNLQLVRDTDSEIAMGKYLALLQLEYLEKQAWKAVDDLDLKKAQSNTRMEAVKVKFLQLILAGQRYRAELNGFIDGSQRNQFNFLSVEQKNIINALNLTDQDFEQRNIGATLRRLSDLQKGRIQNNGKDDTIGAPV